MVSDVIVNTSPGEEYNVKKRFWQGCPTILRTPKGRMFAGWYSGGLGEPHWDNYNLLVRSEDDGMSWSEPELVISSACKDEFTTIDIQLWLDPKGRMWLFFAKIDCTPGAKSTDPDHWTTWAMICNDPDQDVLVWSEPKFLITGFLRTQPTVLSNGDWVMCTYDRSSDYYCYAISKDEGKTWQQRHAGKRMTNTFDENMILERNDKTLLMFARDLKPMLTQCSSTDIDGSNWTPTEYTGILSGSSRFFLRRLKSGKVLLIHSDSNRSRANLTAELSEDDGKTWQYRIMLDPTVGTSYPDAVEAEDGRIFIVYDCGRMTFKEIRMAQITEADIIAGKLVDFSSYLNRIISKAPGNPDKEIYEQKKQEWIAWQKKRYFF